MGKNKKIWALLLPEEEWRPCPLTCDFPLSVEDLRISSVTCYFSSSVGHEVLRTCPVTCVFPLSADEDLRLCPVTCDFPLSVENLMPCMT